MACPSPQPEHSSSLGAIRRWPQFRLRTLLLAFAVISAMLAVGVRIGPVWSLAIGWSLLLIVAHVVGNAWGTKATHESSIREKTTSATDIPPPPAGPFEFAPATRLHRSTGLGWGTLLLVSLGAVCGGGVGIWGLWFTYAEQGAYAGIALGVVCAAALGGFFGFLSATSIGKLYRAWREAVTSHRDG